MALTSWWQGKPRLTAYRLRHRPWRGRLESRGLEGAPPYRPGPPAGMRRADGRAGGRLRGGRAMLAHLPALQRWTGHQRLRRRVLSDRPRGLGRRAGAHGHRLALASGAPQEPHRTVRGEAQQVGPARLRRGHADVPARLLDSWAGCPRRGSARRGFGARPAHPGYPAATPDRAVARRRNAWAGSTTTGAGVPPAL